MPPAMLDVASLRASYECGSSPLDLADALAVRMAASDDPAIFITAIGLGLWLSGRRPGGAAIAA